VETQFAYGLQHAEIGDGLSQYLAGHKKPATTILAENGEQTAPLACFKAYDIRGQLGTELNEDVAYRIGRAYAAFSKPKTVVIGGDMRLSTEALKTALSNGLRMSNTEPVV